MQYFSELMVDQLYLGKNGKMTIKSEAPIEMASNSSSFILNSNSYELTTNIFKFTGSKFLINNVDIIPTLSKNYISSITVNGTSMPVDSSGNCAITFTSNDYVPIIGNENNPMQGTLCIGNGDLQTQLGISSSIFNSETTFNDSVNISNSNSLLVKNNTTTVEIGDGIIRFIKNGTETIRIDDSKISIGDMFLNDDLLRIKNINPITNDTTINIAHSNGEILNTNILKATRIRCGVSDEEFTNNNQDVVFKTVKVINDINTGSLTTSSIKKDSTLTIDEFTTTKITTNSITINDTPTNDTDAVTKGYTDDLVSNNNVEYYLKAARCNLEIVDILTAGSNSIKVILNKNIIDSFTVKDTGIIYKACTQAESNNPDRILRSDANDLFSVPSSDGITTIYCTNKTAAKERLVELAVNNIDTSKKYTIAAFAKVRYNDKEFYIYSNAECMSYSDIQAYETKLPYIWQH